MDSLNPKNAAENETHSAVESATSPVSKTFELGENPVSKVMMEPRPSPSTTLTDNELLQFSEDDIRRQLESLGYFNVPQYRLREFASDLQKLVEHERSSSRSTFHSDSFVSSDGEGHHILHRQRLPLNDASRRGQQQSNSNQSTVEHSMFGKENAHENDLPHSKPDLTNTSLNTVSDQDDTVTSETKSFSRSPERKYVRKRKVVRKVGGHSQVFDESITTENEFDGVNVMRDRFENLPIREDDASSLTESETTADVIRQIYSRRPQSARPDLFPERPSTEEDVFAPHLPRSFIRPSTSHPHTKNLRKTDPVTRYQLYQQSWNIHKVPGEKSRKGLRWAVREQMLQKDEVYQPKRDQKVFIPNKYIVPTDKKRQALRWEIRTDMAYGQMPAGGKF